MVHLYEEDPNFFKNLNGRFQGLVADRARGTVTLFNDRFGLQRVYFHEARDAFYFSAEAKAILGSALNCAEWTREGSESLSPAAAF